MVSVFFIITFVSSLAHPKIVSENQEKTQFPKSEFYKCRLSTNASWLSLEAYKNKEWVNELFVNSSESISAISLDSSFLFFGHQVIEIQISKNGFIHMDQVKTESHDPPYISPLYTNYHIHQPPSVYYFKNDRMLIVWWMNLKHQTSPVDLSFQVIYKAEGAIVFNYRNKVDEGWMESLNSSNSIIGLSDALYKNLHEGPVQPYHVMHLPLNTLLKYQRVIFTPLPSCVAQETCVSCTSMNRLLSLPNYHLHKPCFWCSTLNMCSDGSDKLTHHWQANQCDKDGFKEIELCYKQENPHGLEKHLLRLKLEEEKHKMEMKMRNQHQHMRKNNVEEAMKEDFLDDLFFNDDDYFYRFNSSFNNKTISSNETSSMNASTDVKSFELKQRSMLAMINGLTTLITFIFKLLLFIFIIFLCLINTSFIIYFLEAYFPNFKLAAYLKKKLSFMEKLFRSKEMRNFRTLSETSVGNHTVELRELHHPNDLQLQYNITEIIPQTTNPQQKLLSKTDTPQNTSPP